MELSLKASIQNMKGMWRSQFVACDTNMERCDPSVPTMYRHVATLNLRPIDLGMQVTLQMRLRNLEDIC